MVTIPVICSCCNRPDDVFRHGKSPRGHQRYRCKTCKHVFQLDYIYQAKKPGTKEKIVEMAMNGSGVNDTARVLKIGVNTVLRTLKNSSQQKSMSTK